MQSVEKSWGKNYKISNEQYSFHNEWRTLATFVSVRRANFSHPDRLNLKKPIKKINLAIINTIGFRTPPAVLSAVIKIKYLFFLYLRQVYLTFHLIHPFPCLLGAGQ